MTEDARTDLASPRAPRLRLRVWHLVVGALVAAAIVGVVVWLVVRDESSSSPSAGAPAGSQAVPISVKGLRTIASLGITVYWVGERPGFKYELTKTDANRVYIRYLPSGIPIGASAPYLTIGTYPMKNAYTVTRRLAEKSTSVPIAIGKGGVAYYDRKNPLSVFLAYRGVNYQVEVYDPSAGEAERLVASGEVGKVG